MLLACESYAGDEARPEIDHAPVDARHVLIGTKHGPPPYEILVPVR